MYANRTTPTMQRLCPSITKHQPSTLRDKVVTRMSLIYSSWGPSSTSETTANEYIRLKERAQQAYKRRQWQMASWLCYIWYFSMSSQSETSLDVAWTAFVLCLELDFSINRSTISCQASPTRQPKRAQTLACTIPVLSYNRPYIYGLKGETYGKYPDRK